MKHHELAPHGRISRLCPEQGYGYLEPPEGTEIYFHKNSVLSDGFDELAIGIDVSFVEKADEKGPRASTVRIRTRESVADRADARGAT